MGAPDVAGVTQVGQFGIGVARHEPPVALQLTAQGGRARRRQGEDVPGDRGERRFGRRGDVGGRWPRCLFDHGGTDRAGYPVLVHARHRTADTGTQLPHDLDDRRDAGAVGVDVLDVAGLEPAAGESRTHDRFRCAAVPTDRGTPDDREHGVAVPPGVRQALEYQYPAPVASGAAQRDLAVAPAQARHRQVQRRQRGGHRGVGGQARAAPAQETGDLSGQRAVRRGRTEVHGATVGPECRRVDVGVLQGFPRGFEQDAPAGVVAGRPQAGADDGNGFEPSQHGLLQSGHSSPARSTE